MFISHRGNTNGPNPDIENNPGQIVKLLSAGIQVEVDVRYLDGHWFLGHDEPTYPVDDKFIKQTGLWLHAKEPLAFARMLDLGVNCFWHDDDYYALTSNGFIWTHPKTALTIAHLKIANRIILVMPENATTDLKLSIELFAKCYGYCSDYHGFSIK